MLWAWSYFILIKKFRMVTEAEVFIWENFHPGYRDLGCKNGDLGKQASPASHIWTHRYFYKEKSGEGRSRKPSQPGWRGSYEEALSWKGFQNETKTSNLFPSQIEGGWRNPDKGNAGGIQGITYISVNISN